MGRSSDFERLRILFARCPAPPCVRQTVQKLIAATDNEHCSVANLEEIVVTDPALTARLLGAAKGQKNDSHDTAFTTVRGTILRLGFHAVRALSLTLSLQGVDSRGQGGAGFDPVLVARHSLLVGFLSSAVHEHCTLRPLGSTWGVDEVLAAGVLHELAYLVLWSVDPELYDELRQSARAKRLSIEQAFAEAMGRELSALGGLACQSWGLPVSHAKAMTGMHKPSPNNPDYRVHCALSYADCMADINGLTKSTLEYVHEPSEEVWSALGLDEETSLRLASEALEMVDFVYPVAQSKKKRSAA
jgi:HD-like signal output (HDOD) protein